MTLALALTLPAALSCGAGESDEEEEKPASAPPRVVAEGGESVVTLDAATQARGGVVVEPLAAASHQAEATAYGTVLDVAELAEARGAVTAAAQRAARAEAALAASKAEFERVKTLHDERHNASDKALEQAGAAYRGDEADAVAARASLAALSATAAQRWGGAIASWLERGSPQLEALLSQRERLVLITLTPGATLASPPSSATLRTLAGASVAARPVSFAPRTDPHIQGESLLCVAPASPSLPAGARVSGVLPVGTPAPGVAVPADALVWWQGRAWVYLEKAPGRFVRREVATDAPLPRGWFVATGLGAGERVVVQGAQLLLSEEGRAAVHGSEG